MNIELIDPSKNYDLKHPYPNVDATFVMRHMTPAMQDIIDKECIVPDGKGSFRYDLSKDREIKVDQCVVSWKGISSDGQEVECNAENKKKLPVGVIVWLVREIEERAGLRITPEEKKS